MAGYVAWYGRKRVRLAAQERAFVAVLQTETDAARIALAAEAIRAAQIRALRAKRAVYPPSEKNAVAVESLDREITRWAGIPIDAIVAGYRDGADRGRMSSAVRRTT